MSIQNLDIIIGIHLFMVALVEVKWVWLIYILYFKIRKGL